MLRLIEPIGAVPLYQLKITLRDSRPPIWRRIIVPANIKLSRLHDVLQTVMPWTNSHLHQFIVAGVFYGTLDGEGGTETLNEKRYTLVDLAPGPKSAFIYEYDFGDGWEHKIVVEKVLPPNPALKHAICLAGKNACPPDDSGGMFGYYETLAAVADPKHPEHETMKEWLGGRWDPQRFNVDLANADLQRIKI
jgi:hypothetical protein